MKYIYGCLLLLFFITGCLNKESCNESDYPSFKVTFAPKFPFGRHKYLDDLELKIGGKTISSDNPAEEICLSPSNKPDTIFYRHRTTQQYSFLLAKFRNGETYTVSYNDCEGEFQLNPRTGSDLVAHYRIKVTNLSQGDTLEFMPTNGDYVFITDSTTSEWKRITYSANCYNSFKYLLINKVQGLKKICNDYEHTLCDLEADSVQNLEQITFQQLHNEKLDIEYDYMTKEITIKIE